MQVHVQVHEFPQVCLKTMPGERAGTMLGPFWDNYGTILRSFGIILGPLGTTLGPLGTIFETPFPRFGQRADFRGFSHEKIALLGTPFSPLGGTLSLCGVSEAENKCFFGQPGLRSRFGTISGQILEGLRP